MTRPTHHKQIAPGLHRIGPYTLERVSTNSWRIRAADWVSPLMPWNGAGNARAAADRLMRAREAFLRHLNGRRRLTGAHGLRDALDRSRVERVARIQKAFDRAEGSA